MFKINFKTYEQHALLKKNKIKKKGVRNNSEKSVLTLGSTLLPTKPFAKCDRIPIEKAIIFAHLHPIITKIIKVAGLVFGIFLLWQSYLLFSVSLLKASLYCVSGTALSVVSLLAMKLLKIIAPPRICMKMHSFKCQKTDEAELYYKGDIPIFSIKTQDPYKAGHCQGYMLASQINQLRNIWSLAIQTLPEFLFVHTSPKALEIPNIIKEVKKKLPQKYIQEMQGVVDGFNKWVDEKWFFMKPRKLTLDEIILFHLEPDIRHFKHHYVEQNLKFPFQQRGVACSAIIAKDKDEGNVFASSTDWPTFGKGNLAMVFVKLNERGEKRVEVGIPGFIGTLSGMNEHGLALRMNICDGKTKSVEGIPNTFVTRMCLEQAKRVSDIRRVIRNNPSLGPFHLTTADEYNAEAFFLRQGSASSYRTRKMPRNAPLVVTNFRYDTDNRPITGDREDDVNFSSQREPRIHALFEDAKKEIAPEDFHITPLLKKALKLPFVNNLITAHSMVMHPKKRTIEVTFDNAYASKNRHQLLEGLL